MEQNNNNTDNIGIINYRLTNIESTLSELKTVIVENKLQEKEIRDIKEKLTECLQLLDGHEERLRTIEVQPVKEKASKWQSVSDTVFKWVIAVILGYFAVKFGIKA